MIKNSDLQDGFYLDEWRIEPQAGRIIREFQTISLEPKVMEVLVLLAANYPNVIRKEDFLETIWEGVSVVPHVLTRAVSEIRRVLNDDPRNPHVIETIPKIGYRLLVPITHAFPESRTAHPDRPERTISLNLNRGSAVAIGAAAFAILLFAAFFATIVLRGGMHPH